MTARQVALLVADIGDDPETLALDGGARRNLVIDRRTRVVRVSHHEPIAGDADVTCGSEITQRPRTRQFAVVFLLAPAGDEEDGDGVAGLGVVGATHGTVALAGGAP